MSTRAEAEMSYAREMRRLLRTSRRLSIGWFLFGLVFGSVVTWEHTHTSKPDGWRCVQYDPFGQCTMKVFNKPTDDGARR